MHGRSFGSDAAWPFTRLSHEAYLDRESSRLSPFTAVEGFRLETVAYDWLHNINLGCGRDLFASGLKVLVIKGVWGPLTDWDEMLHGIHLEMHRDCAAHGFLGFQNAFLFYILVCIQLYYIHTVRIIR